MESKPLSDCRIFYLEDDFFMAADLRETLTAAGAEVVLCGTVKKALALLQQPDFDVALLDLNVAGDSAVPVARNLKEAAIPIVFLTGYTPQILPEDLSSCAFLMKPANGPLVVEELEQQLRASGAHDGKTGCARH